MKMTEAESARSEAKHAAAGLAVALRTVRTLYTLMMTGHVTVWGVEREAEFQHALKEAEELLHSVDGTPPAGEVPPIPPLEVPPIPPHPAYDLEFPDGTD